MIKQLLIFLLAIISNSSLGQFSFQKKMIPNGTANSAQQTTDGGYIIGGTSYSNDDYYLVKINALGYIQWSNAVNAANYQFINSVKQTNDGGFITGGGSLIPPIGNLVRKYSSSGAILWTKNYYGIWSNSYGQCNSIEQTADGGYILCGWAEDTIGICPFLVLKTTNTGAVSWSKKIDMIGNAISIQQSKDGGYIALATGNGNNGVLLKMNGNGATTWAKSYSNIACRNENSLLQTSDGGYIIGGTSNSHYSLIKTNSLGDTLWTRTFKSDSTIQLTSVKGTTDGGFVLGGHSQIFGHRTYIVRTDSLGDVIWSKTYLRDSNILENVSAFQTNDSSYFIMDLSMRITKTDRMGNSGCNDSIVNTTIGHLNSVISIPIFGESSGVIADNVISNSYSAGNFTTICGNVNCNLTISPAATICSGDGVSINASMIGQPNYTYSWSPGGYSGATVMLNPQTTTNYYVVATDSLGCSQTDSVNITVLNPDSSTWTQTECDSILFNGQLYTTSGIYEQIYSASNGCDSIITLNLTINSIDVSTTTLAGIITANSSNSAYQWLDCNSGYSIIPGETNQTFTPINTGNYCVIISNNGCVDTSTCVSITLSGINELQETELTIYPNPFTTKTKVTFSKEQKNCQLKIIGLFGEKIISKHFTGKQLIIEIDEMQSGIYFLLSIDEKGNQTTKKILIQ